MKYNFLHSCIRVKDIEKSINFYENSFNFNVDRKLEFIEEKFTLVYLKNKDNSFELELTFNHDRIKPYELGDGYGHLALETEDIEESFLKHKKQGLNLSEISGLPGRKVRFYFVKDPDGYKIEIIQR